MPINLAGRAPTKGDEVEVGSGVRTPGRRYGFAMAPSAPVKGAEIEQPKVVEEPEDSGEAPVQEPATPAGTPSQPAAPAAPSQPAAPVAAPKKPEATMPAAELIAMAQAATTEAELQAMTMPPPTAGDPSIPIPRGQAPRAPCTAAALSDVSEPPPDPPRPELPPLWLLPILIQPAKEE